MWDTVAMMGTNLTIYGGELVKMKWPLLYGSGELVYTNKMKQ